MGQIHAVGGFLVFVLTPMITRCLTYSMAKVRMSNGKTIHTDD
jgi:hypothetical protein